MSNAPKLYTIEGHNEFFMFVGSVNRDYWTLAPACLDSDNIWCPDMSMTVNAYTDELTEAV